MPATTDSADARHRSRADHDGPALPRRSGAGLPLRTAALHERRDVPLALFALGLLSLTIDLPAAAYFQEGGRGLIKQLLECAEFFGHAMGVLFILVGIAVLDPGRRPMLPRIAACSFGAGLVADLVKMTIARTRPHRFDLSTTDVLATFDRWFPVWTSGHGDRSFPSAHTATAFGLAIVLAAYLPRGRAMFLVLAALCGMQRIECGAHYVSDVCCGAAVGWLWASFCLWRPGLGETFDRVETSLAPAAPPEGPQ
jgi:membrane-associated phospholipid phosphatase